MIEFKTNYTEKFINNTPERNFHYDLINQYGPWVATVSNKSDMDLFIASPKMAEYMMERAKSLHDMLLWQPNWEGKPVPWQRLELDKILAILKDAGVEVVVK